MTHHPPGGPEGSAPDRAVDPSGDPPDALDALDPSDPLDPSDAVDPNDLIDAPDGDAPLIVTLPDGTAGQRLDKALATALPDLSRVRVQALLADGAVRGADGVAITDARAKLPPDTVLTVHIPTPVAARPLPEDVPLNVVYEDADLLVIDKPAGMVVHPAAGNPVGTLVNALLHHCAGALSGIGGVARPGIVHRLDKDTSGLMVVAKTDRAHRGLAEQFADRDGAGAGLSRTYLALCHGLPLPGLGRIDAPIGRSARDRLRMAVRPDGKAAATRYRTRHVFPPVGALVECVLETGRTHQIRVHFQHLGHPLIGDPLYGKRGVPAFPRQALHAWKLSFVHPVTEMPLVFSAPVPQDYRTLMETLAEMTDGACPPIPD